MSDSPTASRELGLKFLTGPEAGRILLVKGRMSFGRHRDNSVAISYDERTSRFHAEIRMLGEGICELVDLGSTNGSIRGDRVLRGESSPLRPGDTFCLGSTTFLVDWLDNLKPGGAGLFSDETSAIETASLDTSEIKMRQVEAVLIVDMQSSTSLGAMLGEAKMLHLKQRMFDILQRGAHRHHVNFTKGTGDGHLMTFATLTNAIRAARSCIGDICHHNRQPNIVHPMHIRMSLTMGETLCDALGDRHGQVVNLAFRLISLAGLPGEVPGDPDYHRVTPLVTTSDLVPAILEIPWEPEPPAIVAMPPQDLKGFADPVPVTAFKLKPDGSVTA